MSIKIEVANSTHKCYAKTICKMMEEAAKIRGTGIAKRKPAYLEEKMAQEQAKQQKFREQAKKLYDIDIPEGMTVEIGMKLNLQNQYGQPVPVVVMEVKEEVIIMDANHFLAGKDLTFDVEIVEIVS